VLVWWSEAPHSRTLSLSWGSAGTISLPAQGGRLIA